jgi:hypothetical protein
MKFVTKVGIYDPEAERSLAKARLKLEHARKMMTIDLTEDAGRAACLGCTTSPSGKADAPQNREQRRRKRSNSNLQSLTDRFFASRSEFYSEIVKSQRVIFGH